MFKLLLFIFVLFYKVPFAQHAEIKEISVYDSKSNNPIPYATVRFFKTLGGTYTNSEGVFLISSEFTDTLLISSIGYLSKKVVLLDLVNNVVYLEPHVLELSPITVRQKKIVGQSTFGITKGKKLTSWGSAGYGEEFAQKITFMDTTKTYKINTVLISAERFDETIPVILHIYDIGIDGLPNQDILFQKIVLRKSNFKRSKKQIIIDLSSYNVVINEGSCFVGIEWLPVSLKGQRLPSTAVILTDEIASSFTYTRGFHLKTKDKWTEALRITWHAQTNPTNTVISVKADILQ